MMGRVLYMFSSHVFSGEPEATSSFREHVTPRDILQAFADNAVGTCEPDHCQLDGPLLEGNFGFVNEGKGVYTYRAVYRFSYTSVDGGPAVLEANVLVNIENPLLGEIQLQYLYELVDYGADGGLDEIHISAIQAVPLPSGRSGLSKLPRQCWVRGGSPRCPSMLSDSERDGIASHFEEYLLKTIVALKASPKIARGDRI
jgi:hypothetical protein